MGKISIYPVYNRGLQSSEKLNKDGKALVYLRVIMNRVPNHIKLDNIYLKPNQWNAKKHEVKNHPQATAFNAEITNKISLLQNFIADRNRLGLSISLEELKAQIKPASATTEKPSFTDFIKTELKNRQDLMADSRRFHLIFLERLCRFKTDILMEEVNYKLLKDFENFMRTEVRPGIKPITSANSLAKQLSVLRSYINLAIKLDKLEKNPFQKYGKLPYQETEREALTLEEISLLENYDFPPDLDKLEQIRDMYLFSIYMGVRYSDLINLREEYLTIKDNTMFLSFKPHKKGSRPVKDAPLHLLYDGKPMRLVLKHLAKNKPLVFPKLGNAYMNRQLKEIAQLVGIKKRVHLHQGRTTFVTDMCSRLPESQVISLTGHAQSSTLKKHYIKDSPERRNKNLENLEW
jgi:integrase